MKISGTLHFEDLARVTIVGFERRGLHDRLHVVLRVEEEGKTPREVVLSTNDTLHLGAYTNVYPGGDRFYV